MYAGAIMDVAVSVARPVAARKSETALTFWEVHDPTREITVVDQALTQVHQEAGCAAALAACLGFNHATKPSTRH